MARCSWPAASTYRLSRRGQRQVDLLHLVEVQLVAETADPVDLLGVQRLLGAPAAKDAERRPGVPVELDVRRALARVRRRSACASR